MRLSHELFAIPYGENFIVYAPLRGTIVVCNPSMLSFLQRLSGDDGSLVENPAYSEVIGFISETGLTIESEEIKNEASLLTAKQSSGVFSPTRVTFLVTTNCNLRCVYCYASAGERRVTIPFEICKTAIDLVTRNASTQDAENCHIAFHGGGEPTTAFALIRKCVEYACERSNMLGIPSSFSIVTNGVLTDYQIEWLAAKMNNISVSLDGPADIQNKQRPLRGGQGSFERVFGAIKSFERLGVKPFVRATITNESVGRMGEISRFFAENLETSEFQLEPVAVCGRCESTGYHEPMVEEFVRGVEEAIEEPAKLGKRAVCSAALEMFPDLIEAYCGLSAPNFAITPEGIVTACFEVSSPSDPRSEFFYYGHYDQMNQRFVFDDGAIERLRSYVIHNIQRCKDCFCRWQCAGDCPVRSVWRYPEPANGDGDFRCQMTRELVRRRLVGAVESNAEQLGQ